MTRTKDKFLILTSIIAALLDGSAPLLAHHGAASYDSTKMVTVQGTVTDFQFVNPHAQLYFEARKGQRAPEGWHGELTSPSRLSRIGWSNRTLKPGDSITVIGNRAKNGTRMILVRKIIRPNGAPLPLYEN